MTTIDFGQLCFEAELQRILKGAGMKVEVDQVIPGSINNYFQAARLIVLDPRAPFESHTVIKKEL